jgi:dTDP-4-dehydrorhamnose 3,5-epimerase
MQIKKTSIDDVLVFEPTVHGDHRGFFMETWRDEWFAKVSPGLQFVQENHSKSVRGTLRGLHYQIRQTQGKFIRVVQGEIFDAVVDMRKGSATFGQWTGVILSADNKKSLWVPPGFAHGFYVLSDTAEITYKCTEYYAAEYERSLLWNDPDIGIDWPLLDKVVIISDKDSQASQFKDCETLF